MMDCKQQFFFKKSSDKSSPSITFNSTKFSKMRFLPFFSVMKHSVVSSSNEISLYLDEES